MSFAGYAASSSGCVARPRARATGLTGYAGPIQLSKASEHAPPRHNKADAAPDDQVKLGFPLLGLSTKSPKSARIDDRDLPALQRNPPSPLKLLELSTDDFAC